MRFVKNQLTSFEYLGSTFFFIIDYWIVDIVTSRHAGSRDLISMTLISMLCSMVLLRERERERYNEINCNKKCSFQSITAVCRVNEMFDYLLQPLQLREQIGRKSVVKDLMCTDKTYLKSMQRSTFSDCLHCFALPRLVILCMRTCRGLLESESHELSINHQGRKKK